MPISFLFYFLLPVLLTCLSFSRPTPLHMAHPFLFLSPAQPVLLLSMASKPSFRMDQAQPSSHHQPGVLSEASMEAFPFDYLQRNRLNPNQISNEFGSEMNSCSRMRSST
jgi:hypothetical protein